MSFLHVFRKIIDAHRSDAHTLLLFNVNMMMHNVFSTFPITYLDFLANRFTSVTIQETRPQASFSKYPLYYLFIGNRTMRARSLGAHARTFSSRPVKEPISANKLPDDRFCVAGNPHRSLGRHALFRDDVAGLREKQKKRGKR